MSSGTPCRAERSGAGATAGGIELTLQPYEATVVVLSDEPVEQAAAAADVSADCR